METVSSSPVHKEISEVINNVDETVVITQSDKWVSSNGIVFKLKKFPNIAITEANRRIKPPKIPSVYIEEKGRIDENPSDPDYIVARREYEYKLAMAAVGIALGWGTEVLEYPNGVDKPQDTDWSDDLTQLLDIEVPIKGRARYVDWLRLYALTEEDFNELTKRVFSYTGLTTEEDVKVAQDSFRD